MTDTAPDAPLTPEIAAELVTKAARLVRAARNEGQYPAPGVRLLSFIDEFGPSRVTRLAAIDQCSQPTMTGTVNALAEKGYVVRVPDPADARAQLVELTDEGRAALVRIRTRIGEIVLGWLGERSPHTQQVRLSIELFDDLLRRSQTSDH